MTQIEARERLKDLKKYREDLTSETEEEASKRVWGLAESNPARDIIRHFIDTIVAICIGEEQLASLDFYPLVLDQAVNTADIDDFDDDIDDFDDDIDDFDDDLFLTGSFGVDRDVFPAVLRTTEARIMPVEFLAHKDCKNFSLLSASCPHSQFCGEMDPNGTCNCGMFEDV